jgi:hypothetical protein
MPFPRPRFKLVPLSSSPALCGAAFCNSFLCELGVRPRLARVQDRELRPKVQLTGLINLTKERSIL